ncbi:MAG: hypothetical protein ABI963_08365 [Rhizomicrobium sp.]
MAKFILGLVTGLVIGLLYSSYFASPDLNDLTRKARATMSRHMPVNN